MKNNGRTKPKEYFILCLSQKQAKLLACSGDAVRELALGSKVPTTLAEAERFSEHTRAYQVHSSSSRAQTGTVSHGQGGGRETKKRRVQDFILQVSNGVADRLKGRRAPLVVASTRPEATMFRRSNRYPHLASAVLAGNPDHMTALELSRKAARLV